MKIYNNLFLALIFLFSFTTTAQIAKKDTFAKGFPQQFIFRGEYQDNSKTYESWIAPFDYTTGIIKKYVNWDEQGKLTEVPQKWAAEYANNNKEALMLLHWNAREHRNDIKGSSDLYFPGHWLSMAGSKLAAPLSSTENMIKLEKLTKSFTSKLSDNKGEDKIGEETTGKENEAQLKYPILLLIELDDKGNRIWENYEYVEVESLQDIDVKNKTIKVKRGQVFSTPRSFKYGAYVAPMATRLGNKELFCYNLSIACPKDKNGFNAADVMRKEILSLVGTSKSKMKILNGVAFDVMMWEPWEGSQGNADVNNDGKADGGTVNGRNLTREGAYNLIKNLRADLGKDYILSCDGYTKDDQRALGIVNGMESEGLVKHDDAFRGFAKTINVFSYWNDYPTELPKFNYIVPKLKNPQDLKNKTNLTRLATGTATILGIAITKEQKSPTEDELINGTAKQMYWLGKPVKPYIMPAKQFPDELKGQGVELTKSFIDKWTVENSKIEAREDKSLLILANSNKHSEFNKATFKGLETSGPIEDILISFDLKSEDSLAFMPPNVPRIVTVKVDGLPVYEKSAKYNEYYNNQWGLFGKNNYTSVSFYYRNASGRPLDLHIEAEGAGAFSIKNFKVHKHPQVLAREFENGVVLVNPSFKSYEFNLAKLFPGSSFKKIKGSTNPVYNDGTDVGSKITVPPLNAMFLVKRR